MINIKSIIIVYYLAIFMQNLPLILLFILLIPSESLTSSPTISPNPIYSNAGTIPIMKVSLPFLRPLTSALLLLN